jgi:hypothetical protein
MARNARQRRLFQELKAAGGWPALLYETDRTTQGLLQRLLKNRQANVRRSAQMLVLIRSVVRSGTVSVAEAEPIISDLLFDLGDGHRKQGPNGSCTTDPRARR